MSPAGRLVTVLVVVLVVVGVAVVALNLGGRGGTGSAPSPSASSLPSTDETAEPSATATDEPSASAPSDDEVLAILGEIEEQVVAIRGLPAADIGPPELLTREEARAELERLFAEDSTPEERERDNIALRALGLIGPDDDVTELQLQLIGDSVLGFYDDVERRMVVVTDAGLDASARFTYAHEYAHALQDAAFGLDSLKTDAEGEDDRSLARTALIEGDAVVTMLAWAFAHMTQAELIEVFQEQEAPDTTGIPDWMVSQLGFPYNEGALWAGALAGDPLSPDFTELDAAFADPPDSTEQIIHLDAWEPLESTDPVEAPDLASALGEGWEEVEENTLGEAILRMTLEHFGVSPDDASAAADGWGGDRVAIASAANDVFALTWRLTWDSTADADEFTEAYSEAIDALPFPATVLQLPGGDVLVAHASTDELLDQAVEAGGG